MHVSEDNNLFMIKNQLYFEYKTRSGNYWVRRQLNLTTSLMFANHILTK